MLGGRDRLATQDHEIPNGMVMWPFSYIPKRIYGKMSTGKPTVNTEKATWVKKWSEWILEEGIGLNEVCRRVNEAGISTRRDRKFSPKAIRDIFRSRQLIGEFWWKGERYLKDEDLRILTDEQFEALQKRLDENRERSYYNATKYDYPPLPKMVFHSCGQLMYGIPINGEPYYRCPKCRKSYISARIIWEELQSGIKGRLLREEWLIPSIRSQYHNKDRIAHLEQEIEAKADEMQRCEDSKDRAFRMGMTLKDYPTERVQQEIDKSEENIQSLKVVKGNLENRLRTLREQKLNEDGLKRLCQSVARNIDSFTKDQWEMLNRSLKLKLTVYNKRLVTVNVALPPIRDTNDMQIEFNRL
ncbi:recombinase family protein [Chloroflexota bacterium]